MILKFTADGKDFRSDLTRGISIAIPLDFDGDQPSHFGAEKATREPMRSGDFVGRTSQGAGCNVDWLRINPHCNGTHTETVGHIVSESVPVGLAGLDSMFPGVLVSVKPVAAEQCQESYTPSLKETDTVITRGCLESAAVKSQAEFADCLIVRTKPNSESKLSTIYNDQQPPAFFTTEAIRHIVELGFKHLVVDLPSIDRMNDDGLMSNHHVFWNVPAGTKEMNNTIAIDKLITELVYIPDSIEDGRYLVNLQVPAFCCDAAPSRPILFPVLEDDSDG